MGDEVDFGKVCMADYMHHLGKFFKNSEILLYKYLSISSDFIKRTRQSTLKSSYTFSATVDGMSYNDGRDVLFIGYTS